MKYYTQSHFHNSISRLVVFWLYFMDENKTVIYNTLLM